ncbi:MAG: helix-turn-helix transcriptional regulator [Lachnospiraceae bacterium]|nr:helix-turn-helix transcriptional regulator [Lachnospiraceae bacterium]
MNAQKRIRELMEERNWSDYRLCREANLSASTVANMFGRNNAPTLPTLEAICKAFGITLSQFFAEGESVDLTDKQKQLLAQCGKLTNEQQDALLKFLTAL